MIPPTSNLDPNLIELLNLAQQLEKKAEEKKEEESAVPMSEADAKAMLSSMMKMIAGVSQAHAISLPFDLAKFDDILTTDSEKLESASIDQIATELYKAVKGKSNTSLETVKEKVCQALKDQNVKAQDILETAVKELTGDINHWNKVLYDYKLTNGGYMSATRQLMGEAIPQLAEFVARRLGLRIESL